MMAINISNIGDLWTIKFFRETWYFKSVEEFSVVFEFFRSNNVSFHCSVFKEYFSVGMKDVNLLSCSFFNLHEVLDRCIDFKCRFGDASRVGLSRPNNKSMDFCRPNPDKEEF